MSPSGPSAADRSTMRLLACLVLTTLLASAFAQETGTSSQIEAVNALPNVEVQVMNDVGLFRAGDVAVETESADSAVDPSSVIVDAVSDAVETVAASLSQDAEVSEDEAVVVEETVQEDPAPILEVSEDEAVVVEEEVQETPAPILEVSEDEAVVVEEEVQEDPAPTLEVSEDEALVVEEEEVQEDPAPTLEVIEEEVAAAEETMPEEDEPMLQPVAVETQAPEVAMEDVEPTMELDTSSMSVAVPEPEPVPEDKPKDGTFAVEEPEPVVPMEEEVDEVEEPREPTKKELQAVEKYNEATDNIVDILNKRLSQKDALPLELDEDVLRELEVEVTTLPPTTLPPPTTPAPAPTEEPPAASECSEKRKLKCASEKCKKKAKCQEKCKAKGCLAKKKKKNNKNRKGDDKNKNKNKNKNNKKNKNNNKNNKNKRKNKNKRITNKLFRPRIESGNVYSRRQSKDLDLDGVEQARRRGSAKTKNDKPNKKQGNANKKKNKNKGRLEAEAKDDYVPRSAEAGPLLSSHEELFTAPAVFMGFSNIRRTKDVEVDLSGRFPKFIATVVMSPINVLLTDPTAPLKLSEVTTELTARMLFTAKQARKKEKLKINEVTVEVPQDETIRVLRSDLDLDMDVISAAQNAVSSAIDTDRVARILHHELDAAFDEDNILQNLEDHPSLKA